MSLDGELQQVVTFEGERASLSLVLGGLFGVLATVSAGVFFSLRRRDAQYAHP
ncbi:hypothetical protein LTS16_027129, partial [Friedmanniomyces endolithicus]